VAFLWGGEKSGKQSRVVVGHGVFADEHTTVTDFVQTTIQMGAETQVGWGAKKPCAITPTMGCVLTGVRKRVRQLGMAKGFCRLSVFSGGSVCS